MPRKEYPKSRQIVMQAVMCLIFGATVGLAAFITHQRKLIGNSSLTPIIYVGDVGARLPRGWKVERHDSKDGGLILFTATERQPTGRKGRQITIREHHVNSPISSEEFLGTSGLLGETEEVSADPGENTAQPIIIAGDSGMMVCGKRVTMRIPLLRAAEAKTVWIAASVRPSLVVISIELECPDDTISDTDQTLLQDIAGAMEVQDAK